MKSRARGSAARERWGVAVSKAARTAAAMAVFAAIILSNAASDAVAGNATIELPKEAVARKTLDNGLTIFAKESSPKGLVAIDVKILAGSSLEDEFLGSGISHLVEHMVFKGTKTRGPGEIEREIKSYGGIVNGSTTADITSYYLLLPSENLSKGLGVLKDMLANAAFDNKELLKEKEVVLKEIDLNEDEPQSRLIKRLYETAYLRHPYKYPTIGYARRFKALTRDDILKYYNSSYAPNRMVISIVGGIDPSQAISEAESVFEDLRQPNYASVGPLPAEPVQLDTRRVEEDSRVNLAYLAMGFHSTAILDEDLFALDVLAMILGRGNNSRLNTSLFKQKKLVYSISAWNSTPKDPGLFAISAILDKENAEKAENAVLNEIALIAKDGVSEDELNAARMMVLADFIKSLDTVDAQAYDIGLNYTLTGDPDFSRRYVKGVQAVTKEDVRRVADKYLRSSNLTTALLAPKGPGGTPVRKEPAAAGTAAIKDTLPNGLRVVLQRETKTPTVSITAAMLGGLMAENESNNGISRLTAHMLLKGTASRNEEKIEGYLEKRGGSIAAFSDMSSAGVRLEVLKTDLGEALDLLKDILTNPTFPQDELEKERTVTLAQIREEDDDIFSSGFNALRKEVFGRSPYALRYTGEAKTVGSLSRDDLISFHKSHAVPGNIVLSVAGDIDPKETLAIIRDKFSALPPGKIMIDVPKGERLSKERARRITMDKEQSLVLLGFETIPVQGDDRYALEIVCSALSGTSGRLFDQLRNRRGMAYALGCAQKLGMGRGYFAFYVATSKENVDAVKKALAEELEKVRQGGITDEELALAKKELRVSRLASRQTNDFNSYATALDELYGLGYDNIERYDSRIEKVTKDDVKRAAQKYLDPEARAEITIVPSS